MEVLTPNQSGFRKHRSTLIHLLDLQENILSTFKQRQYLVSVFFDIEKAYDMAWKHGILQKLTSAGICGRLVQFAANFLDNRPIQVRVENNLSTPYHIKNGVPQGSVLSVYCFLLLINDVMKVIPPPNQTRLFADDLNITLQSNSLKFVSNLRQLWLNNLKNGAAKPDSVSHHPKPNA